MKKLMAMFVIVLALCGIGVASAAGMETTEGYFQYLERGNSFVVWKNSGMTQSSTIFGAFTRDTTIVVEQQPRVESLAEFNGRHVRAYARLKRIGDGPEKEVECLYLRLKFLD